MPRRPTIYHREPKEGFSCPVHDCSQKFKTQTGRTKHIRLKHKKNDLQTRTRSFLSVSLEIPPASVSSIDSDHQDADINMPCTPPHHGVQLRDEVAFDIGFDSDGTNVNMTRSPIHLPTGNDNDPSSPPPFQLEVDQAFRVASRANYHPFINGMT